MTIEERYDRLERMARLLYEAETRSLRVSRSQTKKLRANLEGQKNYESVLVEKARTGNSNTSSALVRAQKALEQARGNLKH